MKRITYNRAVQIESKHKKRKAFFNAALNTLRIMQHFPLVISIAFVLITAILISAQRLPVKTYTVADGLLRDTVFKIKQDSRGFLWLCTAEGVSRFDGYAFTNFTTADGLPDRHVNDFLETKNGIIYLATDKGLARLNTTKIPDLPGSQTAYAPSGTIVLSGRYSPQLGHTLNIFTFHYTQAVEHFV